MCQQLQVYTNIYVNVSVNVSVSWHGRLGLVVQRLVYIPATHIEISSPSCILNAASWILIKRVNGNIEKGSK